MRPRVAATPRTLGGGLRPPSETSPQDVVRAAGRRGAGAPPSEASSPEACAGKAGARTCITSHELFIRQATPLAGLLTIARFCVVRAPSLSPLPLGRGESEPTTAGRVRLRDRPSIAD